MTGIVKVQAPLFANVSGARALLYGKGRAHPEMREFSSLPPHARVVIRGVLKAYFRGTWAEAGGWSIGEQVEEQPW